MLCLKVLDGKDQIPLQRFLRDKLETSRGSRIPNSITATSSRQTRNELSRACRGLVSRKSATSSRRLELVSDFRPSNRGNRHGQTISTCQDGLSVRRACLELVGLLDAMEFSHAHDELLSACRCRPIRICVSYDVIR
jgi:hypothetical protein